MLLSRASLQRILGALWLIDGLFQLQPQMFTLKLVNSVMMPTMMGQPGPVADNLFWIMTLTAQHVLLINSLIAAVQIAIGILLLWGRWAKEVVIASIVWSLLVWYAGEGFGMLLTGQASILTGAPGAVILYPLLGLLIYPRKSSKAGGADVDGLLSRKGLRWALAGFWIFAMLLQLQPYWWQAGQDWGQISLALGKLVGAGGLNTFLVDPVLNKLADATVFLEIPLNIVLIEVFLGLGLGLALVKQEHLRPWLVVSLILSFLIWWITQAFGMVFTGFTTDFNSGLLLMLMTLACWPRVQRVHSTSKSSQALVQPEDSAQLAQSV
jgi:hypothetical protein